MLYKYIETLFDAQKDVVDSYLLGKDPREDSVASERNIASERNLVYLPPGSQVSVTSDHREWHDHLANTADRRETPETLFRWHVPNSGGVTLDRLYWCTGLTIASFKVGMNSNFGIESTEQSELTSFSPWPGNPGKVVNVDISTHEGILKAKNRGFLTLEAPQPHVDYISTTEFKSVSMTLFSPSHKARMFALFRHPIDRAVSNLYNLRQVSDCRRGVFENTLFLLMFPQKSPSVYFKANLSFKEWAARDRAENNWMVRQLVGKGPGDKLDLQDLALAKEMVRTKFIVGLMSNMEESVYRFNVMLGINPRDPKNQDCINQSSFIGGETHAPQSRATISENDESSSYSHPQAGPDSPVWESMLKIHMFDNLLYESIQELFTEQRILFEESSSSSYSSQREQQQSFTMGSTETSQMIIKNQISDEENRITAKNIDTNNIQEPGAHQTTPDLHEEFNQLKQNLPLQYEQSSQHSLLNNLQSTNIEQVPPNDLEIEQGIASHYDTPPQQQMYGQLRHGQYFSIQQQQKQQQILPSAPFPSPGQREQQHRFMLDSAEKSQQETKSTTNNIEANNLQEIDTTHHGPDQYEQFRLKHEQSSQHNLLNTLQSPQPQWNGQPKQRQHFFNQQQQEQQQVLSSAFGAASEQNANIPNSNIYAVKVASEASTSGMDVNHPQDTETEQIKFEQHDQFRQYELAALHNLFR